MLAYTMGVEIIEKRFGPSAQVSSITDTKRIPKTFADGRCGFTLHGHIDGQNAFGGPVRQRFIADVIPDDSGRTWELADLAVF